MSAERAPKITYLPCGGARREVFLDKPVIINVQLKNNTDERYIACPFISAFKMLAGTKETVCFCEAGSSTTLETILGQIFSVVHTENENPNDTEAISIIKQKLPLCFQKYPF